MPTYIHTLNKSHPLWIAMQSTHRITQEGTELKPNTQEMVKIDIEGYDYAFDFEDCKLHVWDDLKEPTLEWVVYELADGRFLATSVGGLGYELNVFKTLEEALENTFADLATEADIGEFNDDGHFEVDGEVLVFSDLANKSC